MTAGHLAAALAAVAGGYLAGRLRPGRRLLHWAEDHRPAWSPLTPLAALVVLVALAHAWTFHPRRSLANVRSWRADARRAPAPRFNPDWAAPPRH
ncbi:hypothetical protein ABZ312_09820 [Streptomyces sp. NPDC006207]